MGPDGPALRLLIADDNPVIRLGLRTILKDAGHLVVAEAASGREAAELISEVVPDVAILDIRMPHGTGIEVAAAFGESVPCVMVSYDDNVETVEQCIEVGASGYLVYGELDSADLVRAVEEAAAGRSVLSPTPARLVIDSARRGRQNVRTDQLRFGLTAREQSVMEELALGYSNKEIAAELGLAEKTVKNNINNIFVKLAARTRSESIAIWLGRR